MSRIGRYEIEAEVGRGMGGIVYVARDPRLRRRVAVKTFSIPQALSDEEQRAFRERFLHEAQAAAGLSHPGIVTVYDADTDQRNVPFIAMEFVPGQSLQQILVGGEPIDHEWAMAIVGNLAEALQVAHEAGVVHRDIKPGNILVRKSDGAVKIADFGVARLPGSTLTQTGASMGSPAYMSPEQIRGRGLDGRSDLYSLGVVLYELLCGDRPFKGETPDLVYSVCHQAPLPITSKNGILPPAMDRFFEKALAKDPAERFQTGRGFKRALDQTANLAAVARPGARPFSVGALARAAISPGRLLAGVLILLLVILGSLGLRDGGTQTAEADDPLTPASTAAGSTKEDGSGALTTPPGAADRQGVRLRENEIDTDVDVDGGPAEPARAVRSTPAYLKLAVRNAGRSGQLSLSVDGREVYRRGLTVLRSGVFSKVLRRNQEAFEAWIEVPPGKHEVVAKVLPEGKKIERRDSIVVQFEPGETRSLKLLTGRTLGSPISLTAD